MDSVYAQTHEWCVKACIVANAKNGYVCNFKLYTGKSIHSLLWIIQLMLLGKENDGSAKKRLAHQVVMKL